MKTQKSAGILASIVLLAGTAVALAQHQHGQHKKATPDTKQDKKGPKLPLCPVMGEAVDFNVKTMTDQGPVYFCCEGCIKK